MPAKPRLAWFAHGYTLHTRTNVTKDTASTRRSIHLATTALLVLVLLLPTTALYLLGVGFIIGAAPTTSDVIFFTVSGAGLLAVWWLTFTHGVMRLKQVSYVVWAAIVGGHATLAYVVLDAMNSLATRSSNLPSATEALVMFLLVGGGPAILTWIYVYRMMSRDAVAACTRH